MNYKYEISDSRNFNAPEFAYYALNNKYKKIYGRAMNHPDREICGKHDCANIDNNIPEKQMKALLSLDNIEMRSSCEGSKDQPGAFFIFRPIKQDPKNINYLCAQIDKPDSNLHISARFGKGRNGKYRVVVATDLYPGAPGCVKCKDGIGTWWTLAVGRVIEFYKNGIKPETRALVESYNNYDDINMESFYSNFIDASILTEAAPADFQDKQEDLETSSEGMRTVQMRQQFPDSTGMMYQTNLEDSNQMIMVDSSRMDVRYAMMFGGEPLADFLTIIGDPSIQNDSNRYKDMQIISRVLTMHWASKYFLSRSILLFPMLGMLKGQDAVTRIIDQQEQLNKRTGGMSLVVPEVHVMPTGEARKLMSVVDEESYKTELIDVDDTKTKTNTQQQQQRSGFLGLFHNDRTNTTTDQTSSSKYEQHIGGERGRKRQYDITTSVVIIGIRNIIPRMLLNDDYWKSTLRFVDSVFRVRSKAYRLVEDFLYGLKSVIVTGVINRLSTFLDRTFSANVIDTTKDRGERAPYSSRLKTLFQKTMSTAFDATTHHPVIFIDDETIEKYPEAMTNFIKLASKVSLSTFYNKIKRYSNFILASKKYNIVLIVSSRNLMGSNGMVPKGDRRGNNLISEIAETIAKIREEQPGTDNSTDKYSQIFRRYAQRFAPDNNHLVANYSYSNYGFVMTYDDAIRNFNNTSFDNMDDYANLLNTFSSKVRTLRKPSDVQKMFIHVGEKMNIK